MEDKIGDQLYYNGVKLEVVVESEESEYCNGCYFQDKGIECCLAKQAKTIGPCRGCKRKDKKDIIFKEVK